MSQLILKFMTRQWNIVNDKSKATYEIICKKEVLKPNFCDYNDACIIVGGNITVVGNNGTKIAFENCAPLVKCITKVDGTTIDDAEDLDFVMTMYNLLENSSNYSVMTGRLWFCSRDEATNFNADIWNNVTFKFFVYKTKLVGETEAQSTRNNHNAILKNATTVVPLKLN